MFIVLPIWFSESRLSDRNFLVIVFSRSCCLKPNAPMNEEHCEKIQLRFPLWKYLTQPVFSPDFKSLNPRRFWHLYNLERLELAWARSTELEIEEADALEFLENCWLHDSWRTESELDSEFINFLERCWAKRASDARWGFNSSENSFDEEEQY